MDDEDDHDDDGEYGDDHDDDGEHDDDADDDDADDDCLRRWDILEYSML